MSNHAILDTTSKPCQETHPLGSNAKILLTSVFGPYARDDEYGSRKINPMELYHNQITRVQGPFSLRMFHRSFSLMMIKENISAPCALLDFPTLDRFVKEIKSRKYDIIGITSINTNLYKVKKMCEEVRKHIPQAQIVVGGHIANIPGLSNIIDADHIVQGDGIKWFRGYLSEDEGAPIRHPLARSGFGFRTFGTNLSYGYDAALFPSVGCPVGCNFCSTSALFGGKGKSVVFYETGDELFSEMCRIEKKTGARSFFVFDENFLLYKQKALRLMELIEENNKSWALYVFSSARVLRSYSIDQLVRLGIYGAWIGLEGRGSQYTKLNGIDTKKLVQELQENGIMVLGSTIIGLEDHTQDNIDDVIEWGVEHNTDFHQFMLYMPNPGTPLYEKLTKEKRIFQESQFSIADSHGQYRFNYRHEGIPSGKEEEFLLKAFKRDFEINGPSTARVYRTALNGWGKYKKHSDERIRKRYKRGLKTILSWTGSGAVWAMKKWYKSDKDLQNKLDELQRDIFKELGLVSRILAPIVGVVAYFTMKREVKRLSSGWTYEPPTFYEKNEKMRQLERREFLEKVKRFFGFSRRIKAA